MRQRVHPGLGAARERAWTTVRTRVVDRHDRRGGRSSGALLLTGGRVGHPEEGRELSTRVGRRDAEVRHEGPVHVAGAGHPGLLLEEVAHGLAEIGARAAAEGHDEVDRRPGGPGAPPAAPAASARGARTSANVDASVRPRSFTTWAPSGEARRPLVVTRRALRAAERAHEVRAAARACPCRRRSAGRARCGSRRPASLEAGEQVVVPVALRHPVADEPLHAERRPRTPRRASRRKKESSGIWLAWAAIDARLAPTKSCTSTRVVMAASGRPNVLSAVTSGTSSGGMSPASTAACISSRMWSRFMVASKTRGVPASSAARSPTRCTWMWSGWPYPPSES